LELTPKGEAQCREVYGAWLDTVGITSFGEPLNHGDAPDAVGDPDGQALEGDIPSDITPDAPPAPPAVPPMPDGLADQLLQEIRSLGLKQGDVRMLLVEVEAPSVPRSGSLEPVIRGLSEVQGAALTVRLGELRAAREAPIEGEAA
jgi:hypothetical protein